MSIFDTLDTDRLRFVAFLYGAFLIGIGVLLNRQAIKPHFLDVYLQLGANAILLATHLGRARAGHRLGLSGGAAVPVGRGDLSRRSLSTVLRLSPTARCMATRASASRLLNAMGGPTLALIYFVVTGSIVVIALVVLARRFGRDE